MSDSTSKPQTTHDTTELREIKEKIRSKDKAIQLKGLTELRNLLSQADECIEVGESLILNHLLSFLDNKEDLELQVEASSLLSELFSKSSQYCRVVNESKELEQFINALDLDNQVVLENVLSAINSLLQQDPKTRQIYFSRGCMKKVPLIMEKYPIPPIKKNIILLLLNITKTKPHPKWKEIKPAASILQEAIKGMQSGKTLADALSSVAAITDADCIDEIINLGLVPFLVQHVYNQDQEIFFPALRSLGNIISGNDLQTDEVLALPDFLVRLFELILHPDKSVQKEVCWILSNIAAGSEPQKDKIINGPNYMDALKHALSQGDEKVAIEVSWVYTNLLDEYNQQLKAKLIETYEYLECLSIMLSKKNSKIDELALEALEKIVAMKHPKVSDFIQNDLADKVSQIHYTKRNQTAIENIGGILEDIGFGDIKLQLAPAKPELRGEPKKKLEQQDSQDDDEEEEEEEQNDDHNED